MKVYSAQQVFSKKHKILGEFNQKIIFLNVAMIRTDEYNNNFAMIQSFNGQNGSRIRSLQTRMENISENRKSFHPSNNQKSNIFRQLSQSDSEEITRRRPIQRKGQLFGHWDAQQNQQYLQFLLEHRQIFQQRNVRRIGKIFKIMSKAIRTRDAIQCRSHHQKMERKLATFEAIIQYLKSKEFNQTQNHTQTPSTDSQTHYASTPAVGPDKNNDFIEEMPVILQPSYCFAAQGSFRRYSFFRLLLGACTIESSN